MIKEIEELIEKTHKSFSYTDSIEETMNSYISSLMRYIPELSYYGKSEKSTVELYGHKLSESAAQGLQGACAMMLSIIGSKKAYEAFMKGQSNPKFRTIEYFEFDFVNEIIQKQPRNQQALLLYAVSISRLGDVRVFQNEFHDLFDRGSLYSDEALKAIFHKDLQNSGTVRFPGFASLSKSQQNTILSSLSTPCNMLDVVRCNASYVLAAQFLEQMATEQGGLENLHFSLCKEIFGVASSGTPVKHRPLYTQNVSGETYRGAYYIFKHLEELSARPTEAKQWYQSYLRFRFHKTCGHNAMGPFIAASTDCYFGYAQSDDRTMITVYETLPLHTKLILEPYFVYCLKAHNNKPYINGMVELMHNCINKSESFEDGLRVSLTLIAIMLATYSEGIKLQNPVDEFSCAILDLRPLAKCFSDNSSYINKAEIMTFSTLIQDFAKGSLLMDTLGICPFDFHLKNSVAGSKIEVGKFHPEILSRGLARILSKNSEKLCYNFSVYRAGQSNPHEASELTTKTEVAELSQQFKGGCNIRN